MNNNEANIITNEPAAVEEAPTPKLSEEQEAHIAFARANSAFITKLNKFAGSKRQVARAWANSSIYPLNETNSLKFSYPEEKELFEAFNDVNSVKLMLLVHGLIRAGVLAQLKPITEGKEELADSSLPLEEKKEENNG